MENALLDRIENFCLKYQGPTKTNMRKALYINQLWNHLPEDIKKLRVMYNFSARVKKELLLQNINFPE